jgi:hypothetical protein
MNGPELTSPTSRLWFQRLGLPSVSPSPMPNSTGKDRFAPFEPVWSLYICQYHRDNRIVIVSLPALHCSTNRAHHDGDVQLERMLPFVLFLKSKVMSVFFHEHLDAVDIVG